MLSEPQWALVFGAAKKRGAKWADLADVNAFKAEVQAAIDAAVSDSGKHIVAATVTNPPSLHRLISRRGIDLIKRFEGLRLKAYKCPADVPTIGYGSTGAHVRMGMTITESEAEALLREDLKRFEQAVNSHGPMTQNRFDALTSFAFNLGERALAQSTLLKLHKAGNFAGAGAQFARWNKAGGKVLPGLVKRRAAEAALYLADD